MIESRLQELGLTLPAQLPPLANYVPSVKVGPLVFIAGQIPSWNGKVSYIGKVGREFSIEDGQKAAHLCALNILSHLKMACEDDWTQVVRCVRLGGFVHSTDNFKDQPQVINGASDLMVAIFGERGHHVRAAVGVNALPLGVAVEIEAIFEVKR
jgi:enamine deaminase RidA (YjgF/YER057c/UK114 family)